METTYIEATTVIVIRYSDFIQLDVQETLGIQSKEWASPYCQA